MHAKRTLDLAGAAVPVGQAVHTEAPDAAYLFYFKYSALTKKNYPSSLLFLFLFPPPCRPSNVDVLVFLSLYVELLEKL